MSGAQAVASIRLPGRNALRRRRSDRTPYLLVLPALLALALTVAGPILYNLWLSLYDWTLLETDGPEQFVGLGNYAAILASPGFRHSLGVTASFTILAVGLEFVLGLGLGKADR
ncbi:hypothetical protein J4558_24930 [Leptolyngbya sp. 15MV]|nr:hypothetical protein J4558_24930 [Leptolyngbya sp. 15MV]